MDNRLFNVNGYGSELLKKTLELVFLQYSAGSAPCCSWLQTKDHGLILSSHDSNTRFPVPLTAEHCFFIVDAWLKSDAAKNVVPDDRCKNLDHDGHNKLGWQVYLDIDNNGLKGDFSGVICAIRPAYLWYGK